MEVRTLWGNRNLVHRAAEVGSNGLVLHGGFFVPQGTVILCELWKVYQVVLSYCVGCQWRYRKMRIYCDMVQKFNCRHFPKRRSCAEKHSARPGWCRWPGMDAYVGHLESAPSREFVYRARHNDFDLSLEVMAEIHALVSSSFEVASEPPEVGETIHLVE